MLKKSTLILASSVLLGACTQVDDYMLGKDNTPKPTQLTKIKAKVPLALDWSTTVGRRGKSSLNLKLEPVVHHDAVYTADAGGTIQATERKNGSPIWAQDIKQKIISGPAVGQGYVAVATDNSELVLLDEKSGKELWKAELSGESLSKPVIASNYVFVKTIDGRLYEFDLKSGAKNWVVDHGAPNLILKAGSSPVIKDNVVLAGFSDGKLDAIDVLTGAVLWQRGVTYASGSSDVERLVDIDADPIVKGKTAYLATYQGHIGALSLVNGQFLWQKPVSTYKNLAIDNKTLYLTDSDDVIWAYDRSNGHVKWKQPALKARGVTAPTLVDGRIVVGDKSGVVHVLSAKNGDFLSRKQLYGPIYSAPKAQGKKIYVMAAGNQLNELSVG